ncbi:hypothetical protein PLICRDRAFT_519939 [Plicaturopsis crispa FD-325 SS-3]|nr:hypothetical protein PLICRDRAFT_519939 [Plicaturopsis crispa FD-325 SS-3]
MEIASVDEFRTVLFPTLEDVDAYVKSEQSPGEFLWDAGIETGPLGGLLAGVSKMIVSRSTKCVTTNTSRKLRSGRVTPPRALIVWPMILSPASAVRIGLPRSECPLRARMSAVRLCGSPVRSKLRTRCSIRLGGLTPKATGAVILTSLTSVAPSVRQNLW